MRLNEAYKNEETYWRQKSRVQWLQEGDQNYKFFHAYTVQRRKVNHIERLNRIEGETCENEEELEAEITDYYSKLFTTSSPIGWQDMLQGMPQFIISAMNQLLVKPVVDT